MTGREILEQTDRAYRTARDAPGGASAGPQDATLVMSRLHEAPHPGQEVEPAAPFWSARTDLFLAAGFLDGDLVLRCSYDSSLHRSKDISRFLEAYARVLRFILDEPGRPAGRAPILTEFEESEIIHGWNATDREYDGSRCPHELFEAQAERTPDAVAIVAADVQVTYRRLNERANRLARFLLDLHLPAGSPIGICLDRTDDLVVGLLGILKAGFCYVPLDPLHPARHQSELLHRCAAAAVLTRRSHSGPFKNGPAKIVCIDVEAGRFDSFPALNPTSRSHPSAVAYVLFTSGSTGAPKAVAISHRNVTSFIDWAVAAFAPESLSGVLASTSVCFDLSVFEIFVPLATGHPVILVESALALDAPGMRRVSLVNSVPSVLSEILATHGLPASVKCLNLAGEPLSGSLVDRIVRIGGIDRIRNLYGPTWDPLESTCRHASLSIL